MTYFILRLVVHIFHFAPISVLFFILRLILLFCFSFLLQVLFYFTYGEATPLQVSSFLGKLGVLNLGTGWVLLMVLWASGYQDMPSAHSHPTAWGLAALYALASVSFNFR